MWGLSAGRKRSGGWGWGAKMAPMKKAKTLPAKVSRLQRQVALLKPETKLSYGALSTNNITQAAGAIMYCSPVPQGALDNDRIGDTIRPQFMRVRGHITGINTVGCLVRFIVIKDTQSNQATPVISGATYGVFSSFVARTAHIRPESVKRFKVLYDYTMSGEAMTSGFGNAPFFDTGVIKLSGVTTFTADGGTTAGAGKNQYYMVVLVDGADTGDLNAESTLGFTDV